MGNTIVNAVRRTNKRWRKERKDERKLIKYVKKGNIMKMKKILSNGRINPNNEPFCLIGGDQWNSLHHAVYNNRLKITLYLLNNYEMNIDKSDIWGWTVLHKAVALGNLEMVKLLLECGANMKKLTINSQPGLKKTGLKNSKSLAKKFKRWKVLELLVKREKGVFHESIIEDYSGNEEV